MKNYDKYGNSGVIIKKIKDEVLLYCCQIRHAKILPINADVSK